MPTRRCKLSYSIAGLSPANKMEAELATRLAKDVLQAIRSGNTHAIKSIIDTANNKLGKHTRGVFAGYVMAHLDGVHHG